MDIGEIFLLAKKHIVDCMPLLTISTFEIVELDVFNETSSRFHIIIQWHNYRPPSMWGP